MFGLGAWEIILILGVALVFLGPKKLPEVARTIGKSMRELQRAASDFTRELNYPDLNTPSRNQDVPGQQANYGDTENTENSDDTALDKNDPYRKIAEEDEALEDAELNGSLEDAELNDSLEDAELNGSQEDPNASDESVAESATPPETTDKG